MKINDKRGTESWRNSTRAGLYPNPAYSPNRNRPRHYNAVVDTTKSYTASDRMSMIRDSRLLFTNSPNLNYVVKEKASHACLDSFLPRYRGTNLAWADEVESWLTDKVFPVANIRGGNYNFVNTLYAISVALDVDGDCLIYLTQSRDGFPQFGVIPSHRIGQRYSTTDLVTDGRYKGNNIVDGVILNANSRPLAYRILGDKPEDDYDISAQSAMLLFETQWTDSVRGISNFGSILVDAINEADIEYYLQQSVKLDSAVGLLSYTQDGLADPSTGVNPILGEDSQALSSAQKANVAGIGVEALLGGLVNYFKAGTGEKLESFKSDRPHQNVEAFVNRLERRCIAGIGWKYEMLNPKDIGGASVRLIQSEIRSAIKQRQNTLSRAARFIVAYCVAVGMKQELIPANYNDDWYNWQFNYGPLLTVDNGYEEEADRKNLLLGTTTLEAVVARKGLDWQELRQQAQRETDDLLTRAKELAARHDVPLSLAIDLLSQRTPNGLPPNTAQADSQGIP